ncbi:hypothetical protein CEY16_05020 [Halalkalibacillus sediminis]|uniref:S1 motif domain-containing protein n=1 Tax=Halalkalibacillus sediminis TaxID=2018042 RepID=A0A2I0QXR9_9BACI|nr:ribonuclease E/G [Halalkalibacillus sediminis]PKR79115.1 hypothetical protein CEY16_05020 [Halalkalibacillus sediminis]
MRKLLIQSTTQLQMLMDITDGELNNVLFQNRDDYHVGDIFLGTVKNVDQRIGAAFVNLPEGDVAYLALGKNSADQKVHNGQKIIVQVIQTPRQSKTVTVTKHIEWKNEWFVYSPFGNGCKVSSKLNEEEKDRLQQYWKSLKMDGGVTIRTAAQGIDFDEFSKVLQNLNSKWRELEQVASDEKKPKLIVRGPNVWDDFLSRLSLEEIDEIVVDSTELKQHAKQRHYRLAEKIKFDRLFFNHKPFDMATLIERLTTRHVPLKNGANLTVDRTEAFTVIDVDTGSFRHQGSPQTMVRQVNSEAARESLRQLRLRQSSGAIIIDFINMASKKDQQEILSIMKEEIRKDSIPIHIVGFTKLGFLELTRKRVYPDVYTQFGVTLNHQLNSDEYFRYKIEEDLLMHKTNTADVVHLDVGTVAERGIFSKDYLKNLNEKHNFHFELYLTENLSLQKPYQLYKIGEAEWLLNRLQKQGKKVDKLF